MSYKCLARVQVSPKKTTLLWLVLGLITGSAIGFALTVCFGG